jgi:hypothetical protein
MGNFNVCSLLANPGFGASLICIDLSPEQLALNHLAIYEEQFQNFNTPCNFCLLPGAVQQERFF